MEEKVLIYLSKKLQEEIARFGDDIILGKAKELADYKFACGVIRGLTIANGFIAELTERLKAGDEEDDD